MSEETIGTVQDKITQLLGANCGVDEASSGKYIVTVSIKRTCANVPCSDWMLLACGQALTFPMWERAAIAQDGDTNNCVVGDPDALIFQNFITDNVAIPAAFDLEADWTQETFALMQELFRSGERFLVVLELADPDHTQMSFAAVLLNSGEIGAPAKSSSELTTSSYSIQPSGEYLLTYGENLVYCQ